MKTRHSGRAPHASSAGFVLAAALLLVVMLSALSVGLYYIVNTESRLGMTDLENTVAYYGAEAGMEKMAADLSSLYSAIQAPCVADITGLGGTSNGPTLPGITFPDYSITVPNTGPCDLDTVTRTISGGPNEGLYGFITPMTFSVTARHGGGAEVKMSRTMEVAQIPVFQFGIFSDTDLSYFPGPGFDFGGRIHSNGNLFLATSASSGLRFHERITAAGAVVRAELSNGLGTTSTGRTGPVWIPQAPTGCDLPTEPACGDLQENEGSVVAGSGSAVNPAWQNLSTSVYAGYVRDGTTGAKALELPFVGPGLRAAEIIRRPLPGELSTSAVYQSRLYAQAQMRVLISDDVADLPGATGIRLANVAPYFNAGTGTFGPTNTAFAEGRDDVMEPTLSAQDFIRPPNTAGLDPRWPGACAPPEQANSNCWPLIDGYIQVQARQADGSYLGVTQEWLNLGIARENPDAILKFQRFRDYRGDGSTDVGALADSDPAKFYPINLYDAREGEWRDVRFNSNGSDTTCALGGIMNVVELDVGNLRRWLTGATGANGLSTESTTQNGYILYFSDRRGQRDPSGNATGLYGYEDTIDPPNAHGHGGSAPFDPITPNGVLDPPEDVNENGLLDTFGAVNIGEGFTSPAVNGNPSLRVACRVTSSGSTADDFARKNRVSGARHGLKLVNGDLGNLPTQPGGTGGFTVASEGPVYIQGNYNATTGTSGMGNGGWGDPHASAAVIADAVTLLSNNWTDRNSFRNPTRVSQGTRNASMTSYRMAVAAGKNNSWPWPGWAGGAQDYGLDGGTHNFLRYLERWSGQTLHYRGSLASLFSSEYATGIYKCCQTTYSPPQRDYSFDSDFLDPAKLPPGTPRFRDVVNLGYRQVFTPD